MPETFETFLRIWIAENIGSLGSQTDADELEKAATIKGFYGELAETARLMAALKATYSINLRKQSKPKKIARNMNDPCGAKCPDLPRVL
ncbi:MAG: hypothetical protein WBE96_01450 [Pseudolabrys sp.]